MGVLLRHVGQHVYQHSRTRKRLYHSVLNVFINTLRHIKMERFRKLIDSPPWGSSIAGLES